MLRWSLARSRLTAPHRSVLDVEFPIGTRTQNALGHWRLSDEKDSILPLELLLATCHRMTLPETRDVFPCGAHFKSAPSHDPCTLSSAMNR